MAAGSDGSGGGDRRNLAIFGPFGYRWAGMNREHLHRQAPGLVDEQQPRIAATGCPACGWPEVVAALAPPGQRERAVFLRCCGCGGERDDLEFHEEPCQAAA